MWASHPRVINFQSVCFGTYGFTIGDREDRDDEGQPPLEACLQGHCVSSARPRFHILVGLCLVYHTFWLILGLWGRALGYCVFGSEGHVGVC